MWNFQGLKNRTGCISIQWGQGEKDFPLVSARAAPDRPALCVALCPLVSCGICSFRVLQKSHGKAKKSLPPLTSFACSHYCPKGQRVTPFPQGFKVYVNADRLCGCHYCRKGQRVTPFPQGFKVYANADRLFLWNYCPKSAKGYTKLQGFRVSALLLRLPHDATTPERAKGYGTLRLPIAPMRGKMLSGVYESADRNTFLPDLHTCPYLYYNACAHESPDVR